MSKTAKPALKPLSSEKIQEIEDVAREVKHLPDEVKPKKLRITGEAQYPWEKEGVSRKKKTVGIGVSLSEFHNLKLKFLKQEIGIPQREFCRRALEEAIDNAVKNMLQRMKRKAKKETSRDGE